MKNKILVGVIATCVILGGAIAVGATNDSFRNDDTNHQEDRQTVTLTEDQNKVNQLVDDKGVEVEIENEHGHQFYKVKVDDDDDHHISSQSSQTFAITQEKAVGIAKNIVNGTVSKIEIEEEHGRMEYKIEIENGSGEADIRIDAETGDVTRIDRDDD